MKYTSVLASTLLAGLLLAGCAAQAPSGQSGEVSAGQPAVSALRPEEISQPDAAQSGTVSASGQPAQSGDTSVPSVAASSAQGLAEELPDVSVSDLTPEERLLATEEQADWTWFDDAVIIGDSVSLKLKNFVVKERQSDPGYFGKGQFLTSGSLGSGNALWEVSEKSVHPSFQGTKMLLEESIPLTGAKKIYMMLGINDIAVYGIEGAVENYEKLMDQISAVVPDAEFYIQSATPICQGAEAGALTNENLEVYNQKLTEMCQARGISFVDVASVLRDEEGYLPREYCSDPDGMGIHLTDIACRLWLGYLLEDTAAR